MKISAQEPYARRTPLNWVKAGLLTVGIMLILLLVIWATLRLTNAEDGAVAQPAPLSVKAAEGTLASTYPVSVAADWPSSSVGVNQIDGVVTEVFVTREDSIQSGDIIYSVGLDPVTAAKGAIPAFRDLGPGVVGEDMRQLQQFLSDGGYYWGNVDGMPGKLTDRAIKQWQDDNGHPTTGTVKLGSIMFLPHLPAVGSPVVESLTVGMTVGKGVPVLDLFEPQPRFVLALTRAQANAVTQGAEVTIVGPQDEEWAAVVAGPADAPESENGQQTSGAGDTIRLALQGLDGGSPCLMECESIPKSSGAQLKGQAATGQSADGIVIPTAAIMTLQDGEPMVRDVAGNEHHIEVVLTVRGQSIVTGISSGMELSLPSDAGES